MAAHVDELLDQRQRVVLGLAHADDDVGAEFFPPEDVARVLQDLPVFAPRMRARDALAARAVEEFRRRRVNRDGENIGAEIVQRLHVAARHRRRVGEDRHRHRRWIDAARPVAQHRHRVLVGARVRDHRNAHAVERRRLALRRDDIDDLRHRHRRPVDADEVAVGVVAIGFAVAREAAVGAIGAAAFGIAQQQVEAARARAAVHLARHDAERDRRRRRHLHVLRRAHVRRHPVVVGEVHALGRHVGVFDAGAVLGRRRRGAGLARRHHVIGVEVGAADAGARGERDLFLQAAQAGLSTMGATVTDQDIRRSECNCNVACRVVALNGGYDTLTCCDERGETMEKLSLADPLFATYVIAATIMILKAVSMSWFAVIRMMQERRFPLARGPEGNPVQPQAGAGAARTQRSRRSHPQNSAQ